MKTKAQERLQSMKFKANASMMYGQQRGLKIYETYRRYSSLVFYAAILAFLWHGSFLYAFFTFALFHVHVLHNQSWWKLRAIEHELVQIRKEQHKPKGEDVQVISWEK